eukprot:1035181-Rhodomonas_salina.1
MTRLGGPAQRACTGGESTAQQHSAWRERSARERGREGRRERKRQRDSETASDNETEREKDRQTDRQTATQKDSQLSSNALACARTHTPSQHALLCFASSTCRCAISPARLLLPRRSGILCLQFRTTKISLEHLPLHFPASSPPRWRASWELRDGRSRAWWKQNAACWNGCEQSVALSGSEPSASALEAHTGRSLGITPAAPRFPVRECAELFRTDGLVWCAGGSGGGHVACTRCWQLGDELDHETHPATATFRK